MAQSSIILPYQKQFSIESFIEIMNQEQNACEAMQQFVNDDHDIFLKMMQLESYPEQITILQIAAQNGRNDVVKYIIDEAMKSTIGKQILTEQLTQIDMHDRSIIHWIAQVNKNEVAPCLAAILDAGIQLGINDYVNIKEGVYGCTPLMMAAKQGAIANISVLLKYGADMQARSCNNESVLDLIKYTDPKISIATMKYFIENTEDGSNAFKKIHGEDFNKIDHADRVLPILIAIDLDAALPLDLAQLSALKLTTISALMADNMTEVTLMLANFKQIDFAKALQAYKMQVKNDKYQLINDAFDKAMEKSLEYKLSEKNTALLAEALLLVSFQLPEAHKFAILIFALLMNDAPDLALEGFKKINKTYLDSDNKFILIRNTLLTMININLIKLGPWEYNMFYGMFSCIFEKGFVVADRQERNEARTKLKVLMDDISASKDVVDIQMALKKIVSDNKNVKPLEDLIWTEVMSVLGDNTISLSINNFSAR